jgi:hypothetical protein
MYIMARPAESNGTGGVMGAGMRMMAAGLSIVQVQGITRQFIAYAREKVGEDAVGEMSARSPASGSLFEYERRCRDDIARLRGRRRCRIPSPIFAALGRISP